MIKQNKLSKSILAFAVMLLCNLHSWAQADRTAPVSAVSKAQAKESYPAVELKNFEYDPSNPELSDLRLMLLKTKVDLEYRQSQNQLSAQEIAMRKETIIAIENKVNEMVQSNNSVVTVKHLKERKFTRSQFATMSEADQKEIASNLDRYEIIDLVNGTPESLKQRNDNLFYITVAEFFSFDITRQLHIIKNPDTYIIVKEANEIPKTQISNATLNSLSSEKREALLKSGDIIIVD